MRRPSSGASLRLYRRARPCGFDRAIASAIFQLRCRLFVPNLGQAVLTIGDISFLWVLSGLPTIRFLDSNQPYSAVNTVPHPVTNQHLALLAGYGRSTTTRLHLT